MGLKCIDNQLMNVDTEIKNVFQNILENDPNFWDFTYEDTKEYSHGYHSYPAMMIPQVARHLIRLILEKQKNIKNIFDPFMGSGTSIVEGMLHGLNAYGTDLNPLSRLISIVKSTPINPELMSEVVNKFLNDVKNDFIKLENNIIQIKKPNFKNIDYWFKPYVIEHLQVIKNNIKKIENQNIQMFLWVVFSETVRYVSNTRKNEFKLYRIQKDELPDWNPDVFDTFVGFLNRNMQKNREFFDLYKLNLLENNQNPKVKIFNLDTRNLSSIPDNNFDLLITSPPYGDSRTTVAYGQFSRLSLQWLDFENIGEEKKLETTISNIDTLLLGGKVEKVLSNNLGSVTLDNTLRKIAEVDNKRAQEVLQFYIDLDKAISEISRVMKPNSYQCWVVGNRTVKKVKIPTDKIIVELFKKYNVDHIITFQRNIPNKKMPRENSPSNRVGEKGTTMNGESIVILRKNNPS